MSDSVFSKIIDREIPANIVYEDEKSIAFLDANPVVDGHTLVVPKERVETIQEASGMDYMWDTLVKVSKGVEKAFDADGVNIIQNNGAAAGQEVMHLHFHVIPRREGDSIDLSQERKELEEGEHLAKQISSSIPEGK